MYPILFQFGSFTISSFGVMMVIAFLLGNYLLRKDVVAEGYDPIIAEDITFRAAIGGILGAKLYYLIENIPTGQAAQWIDKYYCWHIHFKWRKNCIWHTKLWCRLGVYGWIGGWNWSSILVHLPKKIKLV